MNWIPVATFKTRDSATPVCERLREAGLHPEIHNRLDIERMWFVSKPDFARLEVPAEEFERGEQMILELNDHGGAPDAIRCPECGSFRVQYPQYTRKSLLTNLFLGIAAEFHLIEKDFYCEDCHCTWPKAGTVHPDHRKHLSPNYFIEDISNPPPVELIKHPERRAQAEMNREAAPVSASKKP